MKHLYRRNLVRLPGRRTTAAQRRARELYGVPLPLQPRRPLRGLAGHPLFGGRVLIITPELLRAHPEVYRPYIDWVMGQADRWMRDGRVGLGAISRSWVAHYDRRAERLRASATSIFHNSCDYLDKHLSKGIITLSSWADAAARSGADTPKFCKLAC
ncbi:MAG: hypothetical protein M3R04_05280 [bacterium]|nr:hypothetical protein [bacterium]